MRCILAGYTDKGKRKKINQDAMFLQGIETPEGQRALLAVICDGMGGFEQGEKASGEMVRLFGEWLVKEFTKLAMEKDAEEFEDALFESWERLFQMAHQSIRLYGKLHGIKLGTTATVMLFVNERYYTAHVGDSRAYEITNRVCQLTQDQNMANMGEGSVQYQTRNGTKKNASSILLQGIGASREIRPVYDSGALQRRAVYLLCSDGFRNRTDKEELFRYFSPEKLQTEKEMKENIQRIINILRERGERDDATVLLIRTTDSETNLEV